MIKTLLNHLLNGDENHELLLLTSQEEFEEFKAAFTKIMVIEERITEQNIVMAHVTSGPYTINVIRNSDYRNKNLLLPISKSIVSYKPEDLDISVILGSAKDPRFKNPFGYTDIVSSQGENFLGVIKKEPRKNPTDPSWIEVEFDYTQKPAEDDKNISI